eukprot:TRINITY_DN1351_c0_g1_i2.p1 TRINITY_DN1351_c0_g1~~TRINITY_DN1351_c0_g1_i2.p1  ORF type:complete len:225 (+),score=75.63 TRINITY_DN1351_c0_g1_i2:290-964(+)
MGIHKIATILMVLGVCTEMNEKQKEVTTSLMISGFQDAAQEAETSITGGQTIFNPFPLIGGVGIAGGGEDDFIRPTGAKESNVIVLTKPLGTQQASNAQQWLRSKPEKFEKIKAYITPAQINYLFNSAQSNMARLNKVGSELACKYNAKAMTDVTGFGLLGHARYLAQAQKENVDFIIHTLPIIKYSMIIDKYAFNGKLLNGIAPETSGGLFICIDKNDAQKLR